MEKIRTHKDLKVFRLSFKIAMNLYDLSKGFPTEEKFSLINQIRRSSRSVSANISEAFRKRKYPKAFISKLSDAEGECAETQVWLDFALSCSYININDYNDCYNSYDHIIAMLVIMVQHPEKWSL